MRTLLLLVVVALIGIPVALLDAAPLPKNFDGEVETYEWMGEKRKRTVRKLKCANMTMEFVKVRRGTFTMGSDKVRDKDALNQESPAHTVTLTRDIWVAKFPVTKEQFAAFVRAKDYLTEAELDGQGGLGFISDSGGLLQEKGFCWNVTGLDQSEQHPVVNVTWNDAAAFCDWMSTELKMTSWFKKVDGNWDIRNYERPEGIRLLTETEYEHATRGGTETIYFTGDRLWTLQGYANIADKSLKAKIAELRSFADFDDGEPFTSPVGKYKPNGFGLYDMTGNVWSWCADWYDARSYGRGDVTDPEANRDGPKDTRVLRGGSWMGNQISCRTAYRANRHPVDRSCWVGFRVCITLD